MLSHRSMHKMAVLLLVAGAVVSAPSFAFADRDHGKQRRERSECSDRDSRRGDRHGQRHHKREVRYERPRRDRDCGAREVRYVEVRRPAPRFTLGVQYGPPVCPPAPVYVPAPVCGAYYDPYCEVRYSSFEMYLTHFSRDHGITVAIRN